MNGNGSKSAAYSSREKFLLAQLVKEYNVVENKKTDRATVGEKNKAWECITTVYNSQPEVNCQRTQRQLRKLWNNLKQRKRQETTALRYSILATGGAPPKKSLLEFINDAAPNLDASVDCVWDSTHLFEKGQTEAKSQLEGTVDRELSQLPVVEISKKNPDPCLRSTSQINDSTLFSVNMDTGTSVAPEEHKINTQPSFSVSTPTGERVVPGSILLESDKRVQKFVDAIQQQQELHQIKLKIVQEKLHRAKLLTQVAEMDLQRAADKGELASLKLKQFKEERKNYKNG